MRSVARAGFALLAVAGTAVVVVGTGSATPDARIAKSVRFVDALNEDPEAPDVTAVVVSNTKVAWAPASVISFRVETPNRPTFTEDMRVSVWIDADDNRATGLADPTGPLPGADFFVNWDPRLRRDGASLLRCVAAKCTTVAARSFRFSYAGGARFAVRADDLGDTRRFRFAARAYSNIVGNDFAAMRLDYAPAVGTSWKYALRLPPPGRN
jgi:hypothetical protein